METTRTDKKVRYSPKSKLSEEDVPPIYHEKGCRPEDAEKTLKMLEGRWKMLIIFHLFAKPVMRFSELERAIPDVSQKMLIQQLRELEKDGIVERTVYPEVPPKVEYALTPWGRELYPALDALLKWAGLRQTLSK